MLNILHQLVESVDEAPQDAPPETRRLAEAAKAVLRRIQSQPLPPRKAVSAEKAEITPVANTGEPIA